MKCTSSLPSSGPMDLRCSMMEQLIIVQSSPNGFNPSSNRSPTHQMAPFSTSMLTTSQTSTSHGCNSFPSLNWIQICLCNPSLFTHPKRFGSNTLWTCWWTNVIQLCWLGAQVILYLHLWLNAGNLYGNHFHLLHPFILYFIHAISHHFLSNIQVVENPFW